MCVLSFSLKRGTEAEGSKSYRTLFRLLTSPTWYVIKTLIIHPSHCFYVTDQTLKRKRNFFEADEFILKAYYTCRPFPYLTKGIRNESMCRFSRRNNFPISLFCLFDIVLPDAQYPGLCRLYRDVGKRESSACGPVSRHLPDSAQL